MMPRRPLGGKLAPVLSTLKRQTRRPAPDAIQRVIDFVIPGWSKDQTRNLEIPGSLVSLAPRNDDQSRAGSAP